ncbi:phage tail protein, partial [Staphylococcus aureus]
MAVRNDYLSHNGIKTHYYVLIELVKFFNYEELVTLQFKSKDWYWNAYYEGPIKLHKEFIIPVSHTPI